MFEKVTVVMFIVIIVVGSLAACAQIIGIEDLPELTPDASGTISDATASVPRDAATDDSPDAVALPLKTLDAYYVNIGDITIDGELADWGDQGWIEISAPHDYVKDFDDANADGSDISLRFAARWHEVDGLFLAFVVTDDVHAPTTLSADNLWRGDSVQIGIDVGRNSGDTYDSTDDFLYGWALLDNEVRMHRWIEPSDGPLPGWQAWLCRCGDETIYEIRIYNLPPLMAGRTLGFSVAVNDDDDDVDTGIEIRDGWLEWTPGIANTENPGEFGALELR